MVNPNPSYVFPKKFHPSQLKRLLPPDREPLVEVLFEKIVDGDLLNVQAFFESNEMLTPSKQIKSDCIVTANQWLSYHNGVHAIVLVYELGHLNLLQWLVAQFGVKGFMVRDKSLMEVIDDEYHYDGRFKAVVDGIKERHPGKLTAQAFQDEGVGWFLEKGLHLKKFAKIFNGSINASISRSPLEEVEWMLSCFNIVGVQACNFSLLSRLASSSFGSVSILPIVKAMFKAGGLLSVSGRVSKADAASANCLLTDEEEGHVVFQFVKGHPIVTTWLTKNLGCWSVKLKDGRNLYQYALAQRTLETFKSLAIASGILDACGVLVSTRRFKEECLQMTESSNVEDRGLPQDLDVRKLRSLLDCGVPLKLIIETMPSLGFVEASAISVEHLSRSIRPVDKEIALLMGELGTKSRRITRTPLTHTKATDSILDLLLYAPGATEAIMDRLSVKDAPFQLYVPMKQMEKVIKPKVILPKPSISLGEMIQLNSELPREAGDYSKYLRHFRHDLLINIWCLYHAQRIEACLTGHFLNVTQAVHHLTSLIACHEYWGALNTPRYIPFLWKTLFDINGLIKALPKSAGRLFPLWLKAAWPILSYEADQLLYIPPAEFKLYQAKVGLRSVAKYDKEEAGYRAFLWTRSLLKFSSQVAEINTPVDAQLLINFLGELVRYKTYLSQNPRRVFQARQTAFLFDSDSFRLFSETEKDSGIDVKYRYLIAKIDELLIQFTLKVTHFIISTQVEPVDDEHLVPGEPESKVDDAGEQETPATAASSTFREKVSQLLTRLNGDEFKSFHALLESPALCSVLLAKFGMRMEDVMAFAPSTGSDAYITCLARAAMKLPRVQEADEPLSVTEQTSPTNVAADLVPLVMFTGLHGAPKRVVPLAVEHGVGEGPDQCLSAVPEEYLAGPGKGLGR